MCCWQATVGSGAHSAAGHAAVVAATAAADAAGSINAFTFSEFIEVGSILIKHLPTEYLSICLHVYKAFFKRAICVARHTRSRQHI